MNLYTKMQCVNRLCPERCNRVSKIVEEIGLKFTQTPRQTHIRITVPDTCIVSIAFGIVNKLWVYSEFYVIEELHEKNTIYFRKKCKYILPGIGLNRGVDLFRTYEETKKILHKIRDIINAINSESDIIDRVRWMVKTYGLNSLIKVNSI